MAARTKRKQDHHEIAKEIDRDLRAVQKILHQPVEAEIARGGLTRPQREAMKVLVASGRGMNLKELSGALGLAHSTVSGIIDRLEKQGLVERQIDKADRRASRIAVSKLVENYVRDTLPLLERTPLAEALKSATPEEREAALEGIRVLRRLLERRGGRASVIRDDGC